MGNGAVQLAYMHPNSVSHSFSDSLMRLVAYDMAHDGRVIRSGGPLMFRCSAAGIVQARNDIAAQFLDKTDAEWLWCIDADMGFEPDIVDRLIEAAHPEDRPVVGALCFGLRETSSDGFQGWITVPFPTLFSWGQKEDGEFGFAMRPDYPVNTLTQVAGTGGACLLIHRSALEKVRKAYGDAWFEPVTYTSGTKVSEDLSFCYRLGACEVPIFVHTGVRTTHHKQMWLSEADYWRSRAIPPARSEVNVIVPVMRRPANAEPFMRSLRASTGLASCYAVADADDTATIDAWEAAGATVLPYTGEAGEPGTFAQKANHGYAKTGEPWLFPCGDDVSFHPGWLDHAQHVADTFGADVIGTNDLANPRVIAGQHATHLLIRRTYIDTEGASWDGPGVLAHPGYGHWYVDDEIVTVARTRNTFAMAIGSAVEHMHPIFGTAPNDDVYALGMSRAAADKATYEGRCAKYL